jgi:hypothetical protein
MLHILIFFRTKFDKPFFHLYYSHILQTWLIFKQYSFFLYPSQFNTSHFE